MIGGGCAGLAAAATLAEHGIPVTLFEASAQLGGRARGVDWQGQRLDNGQHILLGAYSETLRLLRLAGVDEKSVLLRLPLQLAMHDEFELSSCLWLPAPLHILAGLLSAKGLCWGERLSAIKFMTWLRLRGFKLKQDQSLGELLRLRKQPQRLISLLWEPLCLAALNTPLDTASAQVFLNVLQDSFAKSKSDSNMLLPREDLSSLIAEPLAGFIQNQGGKVERRTSITTVKPDHDGFELKNVRGELEHFSHVIIAVSPFRLASLVKQIPALQDSASKTESLTYQPIYTIYLQYPTHIKLALPMTGLLNSLSQWVFDRGQLYGQHGLLAVVISAEGTHQAMTQEALADAVSKELSERLPHLPHPLWHKVIAEKRATFACTAGLQRPQQATPIKNLYLAGDYTAGNYPATIEGAVRSGVQCATAIIGGLQAS